MGLLQLWDAAGVLGWLCSHSEGLLSTLWSLLCLRDSSVDRAFLGFFPHMPVAISFLLADFLCAVTGDCREEHRRKGPLTQWTVRAFLLGHFSNSIVHFSYSEKNGDNSIGWFCFSPPGKVLTLSFQKLMNKLFSMASYSSRWWSYYSYEFEDPFY